jgi:hypothetical protein
MKTYSVRFTPEELEGLAKMLTLLMAEAPKNYSANMAQFCLASMNHSHTVELRDRFQNRVNEIKDKEKSNAEVLPQVHTRRSDAG